MLEPISPLTKGPDVRLISSTPARQLINDWQKRFSIDVSQELALCDQISLYQCSQTKLQFFTPETIEGSDKLYKQLQRFDWYYMPNRWEHRVALADLIGCSNILEVGAAFGDFVQKAVEHGFNIRGIELNAEAVKAAQNRDLHVEHLNLNDLAQTHSGHFDGVCSFQVLEHIAQPREFIKASLDVLKPGGKLIYCVPNAEGFLQHQYNLLDMPPHHMTRWSQDTFRALEEIFPIKLEKVRFEPLAKYHTSGFMKSYSDHFIRVYPFYKCIFNKLSLPLYHKALSLGMRYFFRGQSIYVRFRKLA